MCLCVSPFYTLLYVYACLSSFLWWVASYHHLHTFSYTYNTHTHILIRLLAYSPTHSNTTTLSSEYHLEVRVKLLGFYGENKQWKPTKTMACRVNLPMWVFTCECMYMCLWVLRNRWYCISVCVSVCTFMKWISLFKIVFISDLMKR